MKKIMSVSALVMVFSLPVAVVFAEYDESAVKSVMKKNVSAFGALKKAVDASDFQGAKTAFMTFADNMKDLLKMTPPKGSKADWDTIINEFVGTAMKGADASGQKDMAKVKQAFSDLQALMKKGHSEFR